MPELCVVAAADIGVNLKRFPLVPSADDAWPEVVAALIDGFDVVLLKAPRVIIPSVSRRLDARLRHRNTVLVLLAAMPNAWSQTDFVIRQSGVEYEGIGEGHGYIRNRRTSLVLEGRGAAASPRRALLAVG